MPLCPQCSAEIDQSRLAQGVCPSCGAQVGAMETLKISMRDMAEQARKMKQVKELAEAGEKEQAMALYRQLTGASAADAHTAVDAMIASAKR